MHACAIYHTRGRALLHQSAHVGEVRGLLRLFVGRLAHATCLARQSTLIHVQIRYVDEAHVSGNPVARAQLDHVAGHELRCVNSARRAMTHDLALVRNEVAEGLEALFRAVLLGNTNRDHNRQC